MSGHIAGPWFVHVDKDSGRRVRAIDPEDTDTPWNVAQVIDDCGYDGDTSEANARLIAAAPDLLRFLSLIRREYLSELIEQDRDALLDLISRAETPDTGAQE